MKPLLIVKAGATFPGIAAASGDFDDWIRRGLELEEDQVEVLADLDGALPDPARYAGVIVTGSHAMVTDNEPWMTRLAAWAAEVVEREIPFLGLCFGHQLLAQATGGIVGYHPGGKEIGSVPVQLLPAAGDDALVAGLPAEFPAHSAHAQTVLLLPPGTVALAGNAFEPHHAVRVGRCAWGLQFHPEFDADVMRSYIDEQAAALATAELDVPAIRAAVVATPAAASLLPRFARLARPA